MKKMIIRAEKRINKDQQTKKTILKKQSKKFYNPADDAIDLSIVEHEM